MVSSCIVLVGLAAKNAILIVEVAWLLPGDGGSVSLSGSVASLADQSAWGTFAGNGFGGERVMIEFKGSHFEGDVILWAVRWYVAYPISYRQLEEMMEEHGVEVDHATLNRWVLRYVPLLEQELRARKRPVGPSTHYR